MNDWSQQKAARVAGLLYLLTNATAIFAFYARSRVMVRGDAVQTARNVDTFERLFRIGIVTELLTVAGVIVLVAALYTILKPIGRTLAMAATFWRLAENFVLAATTLNAFAILVLLNGDPYLRPFDPAELQALAFAFIRLYGAGFRIGFVFLGLGSALFAYLWLQSRFIPRWLAVLGIAASLALAIAQMIIIVFPSAAPVLSMPAMAPMGVFEITLGVWLLVRGVRPEA